MRRLRRRLLVVLLPLALLVLLAAATVEFVDQQTARTRLAEAALQPALQRAQDAEARAQAAEARAAQAEASLTAIANQQTAQAAATATAVARPYDPERALERDLGRVFAVYQDPLGQGYDQLAQLFGPDALPTMRDEADYLRVNGLHLAGASTFDITPSPPVQIDQDHVQIHTTERWVYDEHDASDRRVRCFIEASDQTYTLQRAQQDWLVAQIQLASTQRSPCPA
jgi:hypothetical protein